MATTYTPHYNLAKPDRGSTNWDAELNANFDAIDSMLYELELHTNATGNPHQTTYSDVGAAPVSHTHHGGDITGAVAEAINADTVDGLHFERHGNLLRFSSDGTTFVYAGDMVSADYDINGDKVVNAADYAAQAGNADTTDSYHANPNAVANTIAVRDASADLTARTFIATATHGTPPLTVQSQTVVQNLNADKVDGYDASAFALASHNHDTTYVRKSTADTITVAHTFDPSTASAPFILGTNAQGQLVTGLNADMVDGKHSTDFTPYASTSTTVPASTTKWVRIAQSTNNIGRNAGLFEVSWATSGYHGRVVFFAGCHYGQTSGTTLEQVHLSHFGSPCISQARIVYHTTYTGNYAYVELYCVNNSSSSTMTVEVKLIDSLGWSLITPIDGSIPSGYTSKSLTFARGFATTEQLKSSVATGTAPIVVDSTTVCSNLNADMVDGKHASELTRIITSNLTLSVPSQYSTIQAALDSIRDAFIPNNVYVTIQVASGTYTHTSQITVSHPCGSQIKIIGANPVTTTLTGVGTITGSAGNWSVPLQVQSASGIAVGDFVIVNGTTGTGDHYALRGVWEVTGVSGNTVTVKNTHRKSSFPSFTVSGGTVVALKTILRFNGCSGIIVYDATLGYLDNVAIVGNLTSDTRGIAAGKTIETQVRESGGVVVCGSNVGVSSFTNGLYACSGTIFAQGVASSGNVGSGFYAAFSGSINASSATASGNSSSGFYATYSGSINAPYATSSGNGSYGFCVVSSGSINAHYATSSGNGSYGLYATYSGSIYAPYATASSNSGHGFCATCSGSVFAPYATTSENGSCGFYATYSGSIYAPSTTASGNSTDYKAEKMGYIYVSGYQGSPTFSPAINTVGNYNAIITT